MAEQGKFARESLVRPQLVTSAVSSQRNEPDESSRWSLDRYRRHAVAVRLYRVSMTCQK